MKWAVKPKRFDGNIRVVKKFAFFPTECKKFVVWLEFYESVQKCIELFDKASEKTKIQWVEIERKPIE